ncbi:ATP-binding protein [Streptomyces sp. NPDC059255]|uniref:ATP-binding protein n=1 Tax=Streptomyces sp. NPDC059255 TaxID=3346793 RepID=UPI0036D05297
MSAATNDTQAPTGWGLSGLEDSAVLILSELLTNAARHARVSPARKIETRYLAGPHGLRIEVHDASCEQPRTRTPDVDACDGLVIVEDLADQWGVHQRERGGVGKVVRATLSG